MSFIFKDGRCANAQDLKCVILCAGGGSRIAPLAPQLPKALINYGNRPILDWVIDYWKAFTKRFVFVVGYEREKVIQFVKTKDILAEFVEQDNPKGIADALHRAEGLVSEDFIMVLGDCICKGNFKFPPRFDQGVGIYPTATPEDIKRSYSVELKDETAIRRVVEKPKALVNNLCGMGYYFLNKKVFTHIQNTPPSPLRGELEITDVLQHMLDSGETITPLFFDGEYININYPEDLLPKDSPPLQKR